MFRILLYLILFILFSHPLHCQLKTISKSGERQGQFQKILKIGGNSELEKTSITTLNGFNTLDFSFDRIRKPIKVVSFDENGLPGFIKGRVSPEISNIERQAKKYLEEVSHLFRISNTNSEFEIIQLKKDKLGMDHVIVHQYYNGIRVYNSELRLHAKRGIIETLNGRAFPTPEIESIEPQISRNQAVEIAKRLGNFRVLDPEIVQALSMDIIQAELVIYHEENDSEKERLAYFISAYESLADKYTYIIDANTGGLISKFSELCKFHNHELMPPDGPKTAQAADLNNVTRTINTYEFDGIFFLIDATRSMFKASQSVFPNEPIGTIWTLNALGNSPQSDDFEMSHVVSADNNWDDASAVSAHYNAGVAYEYFQNVHQRESINGSGGNIISLVNVADSDGSEMDNAFWNGVAMWYGNGKDAFFPLAGGLDVGGHEMTHGVIQSTANLEYQGESGALNESFADIFAAMMDSEDWLIGEDVVRPGFFPGGALRSLEDPHNGGTQLGDPGWQPKHTDEQFTGAADNGGVHINSGIPNHAFYLIAEEIGRDKAEDIFYRALTIYLTRSSQFVDLRNAVTQSTEDLFGSSELSAVNAAFDAVGINAGEGGNYQEDIQENPGEDFLLYSNDERTQLNIGSYLDNSVQSVFDPATNIGPISKPSITDDGSIIVYVNSNKQLQGLFIDWDNGTISEQVIQDQPVWSNVVISKNGNRIAAVEDAANPRIQVFDFILEEWYIGIDGESGFELYNPTYTEGVATGDVKFADAMEFDITGEILMYDAYSEITGSGGETIGYWDIGFLNVFDNSKGDWADGFIGKLFSQLPEEVSIGNPTFAKNSPHIVAFDYIEGSEYAIIGVNIETGDIGEIFQNTGLGYPSYTSDDNQVIFTNEGLFWIDIGVLDLNSDKITSVSNSERLLVSDSQWGVAFSNGLRIISNVEESVLNESILIFPNPSSEFLFIKFELTAFTDSYFNIYDLNGRLIQQVHRQNGPGKQKEILDIRNLAAGQYIFNLVTESGSHSIPFSKL